MKKQSGICNSGNYEVLIKGDTTENINYFVTTEFLWYSLQMEKCSFYLFFMNKCN